MSNIKITTEQTILFRNNIYSLLSLEHMVVTYQSEDSYLIRAIPKIKLL